MSFLRNLGLIEEFDEAVVKRDKLKLRGIPAKCFLDEQNIEAIIKSEMGKNDLTTRWS